MAGEWVPLVLVPRFTTFAGVNVFTTIGMDVTDYDEAIVNVWRGASGAGSGTFDIKFEESTDQNSWATCTNGTGGDPGANTEAQYTPTLKKRWFRARIELASTDPAFTMWAVGFLQLRET